MLMLNNRDLRSGKGGQHRISSTVAEDGRRMVMGIRVIV
jgi:hypothetical protein